MITQVLRTRPSHTNRLAQSRSVVCAIQGDDAVKEHLIELMEQNGFAITLATDENELNELIENPDTDLSLAVERTPASVPSAPNGHLPFPTRHNAPPVNKSAQLDSQLNQLTDRQFTVMTMIFRGMMNKNIARRLSVSLRTVESDRAQIFEAFEVESAVELVRELCRLGFESLLDEAPAEQVAGVGAA